jgi:hypothetical protein
MNSAANGAAGTDVDQSAEGKCSRPQEARLIGILAMKDRIRAQTYRSNGFGAM